MPPSADRIHNVTLALGENDMRASHQTYREDEGGKGAGGGKGREMMRKRKRRRKRGWRGGGGGKGTGYWRQRYSRRPGGSRHQTLRVPASLPRRTTEPTWHVHERAPPRFAAWQCCICQCWLNGLPLVTVPDDMALININGKWPQIKNRESRTLERAARNEIRFAEAVTFPSN